MSRPLWSDAGTDPETVAKHLQELADTATALRFQPRPLAGDVDRSVLHRAAILRARQQVTTAHGEQDRILAQEVRAIDDLVRSANLLVERLREWYALHAPEAVRAAETKQLARLVAESEDRATVLAALEMADAVSMGTDIAPEDLAVLRGFAAALQAVHASWDALEARVQGLMEKVAPNIASVAGPVIGARLIAQAGNLQRLAGFPSGTVQTLGAETALFRHIKEGTKPPKHGILFQHPKVFQAPPWQRGPIARAMALHISLAARADAFTQRDLRDELAAGLEKDLARIAQDRATPPKRGPPSGQHGRGPPKYDRKSGGAPRGKPGGYGDRPGGRGPGGPRQYGGKPGGKPGSGGPRRDDRDGNRGPRRNDRDGGRGPRRDDRSDDRRKKGPGAFRNQGDGPARPPGGKK